MPATGRGTGAAHDTRRRHPATIWGACTIPGAQFSVPSSRFPVPGSRPVCNRLCLHPARPGCEHELSGSRPPPCPTLKRRAESTKGAAAPSLVRVDAPRQRGFVHSAWKFTSARALRTLMHAHAAEPASSPRPMLNRRAGRTTGAAAPARWGMRMRSAGVPPSSRLQGQDALAPRRNVNPCLRTCPDLRCDVL